MISNPNEDRINVKNYYHFGNLLEIFSRTAGLPKLNTSPIYHLPKKEASRALPEKFVVIHALSNAESRMWPDEKWNALADYLITRGLHVVEIGLQARIKNNSTMFIDLCGKLSFTEIAFLIKKCTLFIGIDSSFAHFANALNNKRMLVLLGDLYDFVNYIPYSGLSEDRSKTVVVRQNGPLRDLSVETVVERIKNEVYL